MGVSWSSEHLFGARIICMCFSVDTVFVSWLAG